MLECQIHHKDHSISGFETVDCCGCNLQGCCCVTVCHAGKCALQDCGDGTKDCKLISTEKSYLHIKLHKINRMRIVVQRNNKFIF